MKSPELSRREVLGGGLAALFTSVPGVDALAQWLQKMPEIRDEISELRKELKKGGRYFRELHQSVPDSRILREMVLRMSDVGERLRHVHKRGGATQNEKTYVNPAIPGLSVEKFELFESVEKSDGTFEPLFMTCNAFKVHALGTTYEATAEHCLRGSVIRRKFYSNPTKADFAIRRVSREEYSGPALSLDARVTNDVLSGCLGLTFGTKRGVEDAFYAPLVKMTEPMLELIKDGKEADPRIESQIRNGYWKIVPPHLARVETVVNGQPTYEGSGRSGSIEVAYDPERKGYVLAGNFVMGRYFTTGPFAGHMIAFYSGTDAMLSVVEEERGDVPPDTRLPSKRERPSWIKGIFGN